MSRPARLALAPEAAPASPGEEWETVREFAERLHCSRDSIEALIREGLPAVDLGTHHPNRRRKRLLRIPVTRALAWLEARR